MIFMVTVTPLLILAISLSQTPTCTPLLVSRRSSESTPARNLLEWLQRKSNGAASVSTRRIPLSHLLPAAKLNGNQRDLLVQRIIRGRVPFPFSNSTFRQSAVANTPTNYIHPSVRDVLRTLRKSGNTFKNSRIPANTPSQFRPSSFQFDEKPPPPYQRNVNRYYHNHGMQPQSTTTESHIKVYEPKNSPMAPDFLNSLLEYFSTMSYGKKPESENPDIEKPPPARNQQPTFDEEHSSFLPAKLYVVHPPGISLPYYVLHQKKDNKVSAQPLIQENLSIRNFLVKLLGNISESRQNLDVSKPNNVNLNIDKPIHIHLINPGSKSRRRVITNKSIIRPNQPIISYRNRASTGRKQHRGPNFAQTGVTKLPFIRKVTVNNTPKPHARKAPELSHSLKTSSTPIRITPFPPVSLINEKAPKQSVKKRTRKIMNLDTLRELAKMVINLPFVNFVDEKQSKKPKYLPRNKHTGIFQTKPEQIPKEELQSPQVNRPLRNPQNIPGDTEKQIRTVHVKQIPFGLHNEDFIKYLAQEPSYLNTSQVKSLSTIEVYDPKKGEVVSQGGNKLLPTTLYGYSTKAPRSTTALLSNTGIRDKTYISQGGTVTTKPYQVNQATPLLTFVNQATPILSPVNQANPNVSPVNQVNSNVPTVNQVNSNVPSVNQANANVFPLNQASLNVVPMSQANLNVAPVNHGIPNLPNVNQENPNLLTVKQGNPNLHSINQAKTSNSKITPSDFIPNSKTTVIDNMSPAEILLHLAKLNQNAIKDHSDIPGRAGIDYPILHQVPYTNFYCSDQNMPGFFADVETRCQSWHYCNIDGRQDSFLCPNGTVFSQTVFICDWWYNVDCSISPKLYPLNQRLYLGKVPEINSTANQREITKELLETIFTYEEEDSSEETGSS